MPPTSVSLDNFKQLFVETKILTKNFSKFDPNVLAENPQRLLVLRLALGMSQNQFEKFINLQSKNTSKYELGKIKKMTKITASNYMKKIEIKMKNTDVTKQQIIKNYQRMVKESNGYIKAHQGEYKILLAQRKGAINSLRNRGTRQETFVNKKLLKNHIENEINYPLHKNRAIITDIFIKKQNIAVECKDLKTQNYYEYKKQIQRLAYQGYKIKFYFPEIKLIALINSNFKISKRDIDELKGPFNNIFTDVESLINNIVFS